VRLGPHQIWLLASFFFWRCRNIPGKTPGDTFGGNFHSPNNWRSFSSAQLPRGGGGHTRVSDCWSQCSLPLRFELPSTYPTGSRQPPSPGPIKPLGKKKNNRTGPRGAFVGRHKKWGASYRQAFPAPVGFLGNRERPLCMPGNLPVKFLKCWAQLFFLKPPASNHFENSPRPWLASPSKHYKGSLRKTSTCGKRVFFRNTGSKGKSG